MTFLQKQIIGKKYLSSHRKCSNYNIIISFFKFSKTVEKNFKIWFCLSVHLSALKYTRIVVIFLHMIEIYCRIIGIGMKCIVFIDCLLSEKLWPMEENRLRYILLTWWYFMQNEIDMDVMGQTTAYFLGVHNK